MQGMPPRQVDDRSSTVALCFVVFALALCFVLGAAAIVRAQSAPGPAQDRSTVTLYPKRSMRPASAHSFNVSLDTLLPDVHSVQEYVHDNADHSFSGTIFNTGQDSMWMFFRRTQTLPCA